MKHGVLLEANVTDLRREIAISSREAGQLARLHWTESSQAHRRCFRLVSSNPLRNGDGLHELQRDEGFLFQCWPRSAPWKR